MIPGAETCDLDTDGGVVDSQARPAADMACTEREFLGDNGLKKCASPLKRQPCSLGSRRFRIKCSRALSGAGTFSLPNRGQRQARCEQHQEARVCRGPVVR